MILRENYQVVEEALQSRGGRISGAVQTETYMNEILKFRNYSGIHANSNKQISTGRILHCFIGGLQPGHYYHSKYMCDRAPRCAGGCGSMERACDADARQRQREQREPRCR